MEHFWVVICRLLRRLRKTMADKYNLTNKNDFNEFVSVVTEAVSIGSKTDWSFSAGCSFTFATLTTVGKKWAIDSF